MPVEYNGKFKITMQGIYHLQNALLQPKDHPSIFSKNQHLALRAMGLSEDIQVDYT